MTSHRLRRKVCHGRDEGSTGKASTNTCEDHVLKKFKYKAGFDQIG